MIGMIFPLRLITPLTNPGVWGMAVISVMPMISRIFRISMPYSSSLRTKLRYREPVRVFLLVISILPPLPLYYAMHTRRILMTAISHRNL